MKMASHEARRRNRLSSQESQVGYFGYSRAIAKPAFYKPAPRWHFFAALAGALTLEVAAVAVASLHESEEIPVGIDTFQDEQPTEVILTEVPPEPTPPPEDPLPSIPLPPTEPTEFLITEPTPPPRLRNASKPRTAVAALKAASAISGSTSFFSGQANMTFAPHPSYPYEARRARQTGSGRFLLKFDSLGTVTDVGVAQSTGSEILDQISMSTLRRWRCKPGIYKQVYVPITFTLAGAQLSDRKSRAFSGFASNAGNDGLR